MKQTSLFLAGLFATALFCCQCAPPTTAHTESSVFYPWPTSSATTVFCEDARGFIWIGTEKGLNRYNGVQYRHYLNDESDNENAFFPYIYDLFSDSRGRLWVGSENGVDMMADEDRFTTFGVPNGEARHLFENNHGRIFVDCRMEILQYNEEARCLETAIPLSNGIADISPMGDIWVAGKDRLSCYDKDLLKLAASFSLEKEVTSACIDREGILWMAHGQGLTAFSTLTRDFLPLPASLSALRSRHIRKIRPYGEQGMLFLTEDNGIFLYTFADSGVKDSEKGDLPFSYPFAFSQMTDLYLDSRHNVWLGYKNNPLMVERTFEEGENPVFIGMYNFPIKDLGTDPENRIWFESENGLKVCFDAERLSGTVAAAFPPQLDKPGLLEEKDVQALKARIPFRHVSFAVDDGEGAIWIGVLSTLIRLDKEDGSLRRYPFFFQDGPSRTQFSDRAAALLPGHRLAFGSNQGLVIIRTDIPFTSHGDVPFYLESLSVSGRPVEPVRGGILEKDILFTDAIHLDHSHRSISISFIALSYANLVQYTYRYKMSHVDSDWGIAGNIHAASYEQLPYGKHRFVVEAVPDNPDLPVQSRTLEVNVHRPWWASYPAYLVYLLAFLALVQYIVRLLKTIQRNQVEAALAASEQEQRQKLYETNMNMFANIAHEFRTPLTMISGAISTLMGKNIKPAETDRMHTIILRNSNRMLKLVGQLLDFNKLENRMLRLSLDFVAPIPIVQGVLDSFYFGARQKDIDIRFRKPSGDVIIPLDADKFEKIVYNLLSNAIKFSTMGGHIEVELSLLSGQDAAGVMPEAASGQEYLMLTVTDDGIGIPEEDLERVFERYFRTDDAKREQIGGTGIGLYMSRQLTLLHHGLLHAEKPENGGPGSVFRLVLPASKEAYSEEDFRVADTVSSKETAVSYVNEVLSNPLQTPAENKATVMVVDDDYEMLYYLRSLLSNDYNVVTYFNATTAYAAIQEVNPDLILSDVLMLEMDGFKFCQMVKNNISTCHKIVILLTAKSTTEDQVRGLNVGANAYVTKPFDPDYLLSLIKSQLANAAILRDQLGRTTIVGDIEDQILGEKDKTFLNTLYAIMEEELSNPELNTGYVAERLMMGRTSLYYKVKQLTGETPVNIFKRYKLNRSVEMLKEGKLKISAIAEAVGFSPSYYAKVFQEEFGVLPSLYSTSEGR